MEQTRGKDCILLTAYINTTSSICTYCNDEKGENVYIKAISNLVFAYLYNII